MPPLKNGSLGRGLGDLLGGVPENLGVAGASRPNRVPPESVVPEGASEIPASQSSALQPAADGGASSREPASLNSPVEKRSWTPVRAAMAFVAGIGLVVVGAGMGVWLSQKPLVAIPERIVLVTNTVVKTVMAQPAPSVVSARVDVAELQALEGQGLKGVVEGDGSARIIFDEPVFSSRVVLDPGRTGLLEQLGEVLASHSSDWDVQVTGHTDTVPPRTGGPYRDNNELGLARATEVVRYLLRHTEVPASMIHTATAGENQPPFPGDDAESHRKNRTVTLQISAVMK